MPAAESRIRASVTTRSRWEPARDPPTCPAVDSTKPAARRCRGHSPRRWTRRRVTRQRPRKQERLKTHFQGERKEKRGSGRKTDHKKINDFLVSCYFFSKCNSKLKHEWQPLTWEERPPLLSPEGYSDKAMNETSGP